MPKSEEMAEIKINKSTLPALHRKLNKRVKDAAKEKLKAAALFSDVAAETIVDGPVKTGDSFKNAANKKTS